MKNRYTDITKLVINVNELELTDTAQVLIYHGDKWYDEVTVDLKGKEEKFETLKPFIVYVAKNLYKIDMIAQKYSALRGENNFAHCYEVAYICFNTLSEVSVRYYGMRENTEFDVVFECLGNEFLLKSFGMIKNIPSDWNKEQ